MKIEKFYILSLVFLISQLAPASQAASTITVATFTYSDAPFVNCTGREFHKDYPGISIEMLKSLEDTHIKFDIKRMSKKTAYKLFTENKVDALFPINKQQILSAVGQYPADPVDDKLIDKFRHISRAHYQIYLPKHSQLTWKNNRLINGPARKLNLATYQNSYLASKLNKSSLYSVYTYTSPKRILSELLNGRVDGSILLKTMAEPEFKKNTFLYKSISDNGLTIIDKYRFLVFNKGLYSNAKPLIESIWNRLGKLNNTREKSEFTQKLWDKYIYIPEHLVICK